MRIFPYPGWPSDCISEGHIDLEGTIMGFESKDLSVGREARILSVYTLKS